MAITPPPPPIDEQIFKKRNIDLNAWYLRVYFEQIRSFANVQKILQRHFFSRLPFLYFLVTLQAKIGMLQKFTHKALGSYFRSRHKKGKVDIPYFELVLTTKCTLRCESCNNLMQYFSPKNQYTCTFEGMQKSLDSLLAHIDSVQSVRIIGGEPLLFKDLDKIIAYLGKQRKVMSFNIVTNATILFKQEALNALKSYPNSMVYISDYSVSPNIKVPLKQESLIQQLKDNNIPYHIYWNNNGASWHNPGKIYKRNRTKEDIIRNYKACMMPCVSLMSNEGIRNNKENGESDIAPNGALFVCPVASSLSRLRGLSEFEGDFVNLSGENVRERIVEFYGQTFFKACDYCHDMWEEKELIPIAVQTDEVLQVSHDKC